MWSPSRSPPPPSTHVPPWQESGTEQTIWLPVSQGLPSGFGGVTQRPVAGLHVPAIAHWSTGAHTTGSFDGLEQTPVAGSQVPATWQASMGTHTTGFEPVQSPARHVSVCVQASPSSHAVPSGRAAFEHRPVFGSQTPTWHWSSAAHTIGLPPTQRPPAHVSLCVHASPSLHRVPSIAALCRQVRETGSQLSIVQGSPSLQSECLLHPSAGDALRRSNETANAKS